MLISHEGNSCYLWGLKHLVVLLVVVDRSRLFPPPPRLYPCPKASPTCESNRMQTSLKGSRDGLDAEISALASFALKSREARVCLNLIGVVVGAWFGILMWRFFFFLQISWKKSDGNPRVTDHFQLGDFLRHAAVSPVATESVSPWTGQEPRRKVTESAQSVKLRIWRSFPWRLLCWTDSFCAREIPRSFQQQQYLPEVSSHRNCGGGGIFHCSGNWAVRAFLQRLSQRRGGCPASEVPNGILLVLRRW